MEQYQQHIEPDAPQAQVPEELHPIAAAFGGDIGAALQKTGSEVSSRVEQLVQHMSMMNYYRGQQAVADKVLQMNNDQSPVLYGDPNDPNATVTKNKTPIEGISPNSTLSAGSAPSSTAPFTGSEPQSYEVPAGILQRKGNQAAGALQDYHDWYQNYSQQMIDQARNEGLGERNIRSMKLRMDTDFATNGRFIADHEATELDKAQQQTFLKGMQLDADNAVTRQDPVSLSRTIESINDQNKTLNDSQGKSDDDPIRELTSNKFVSQALNNSMSANLRANGGDPTQFQVTLDRLHDGGKINDTVYDTASEHLDKTAKGIYAQNEVTAKTQTVNQRMNTMQLALQGKLDMNNPNTTSEISAQDPELGTALSNYNLNKNSNIKDEDESFADATEKVFSAGSKEQVSKYMTNVLKESKISQDRLNILFGAALDRGKNLADLDGQSKSSSPMQNMVDGGMKAISKWNKEHGWNEAQPLLDYMTGVKSKSVSEAYNDAVTNSIVRNNPNVAQMSAPPNMVIDKNSDVKYVFPKTHRKEDGSDTTNSGE